MQKAVSRCDRVDQRDIDFRESVRVVIAGNLDDVTRRLAANPGFATVALKVGARRGHAADDFIAEISHYLYVGDTALHMAAAAFRPAVCALLVEVGANCRARNRRGAEPLHYAADANHWDPAAQSATIAHLISVGADPNATDADGTAPLHRAVRTRSLPAVLALVDGGADVMQANRSRSTPLHLAVQTTGRGGSGSLQAHEQQAGIIRLLLHRGASATAKNGHGQSVYQAATSAWIRTLLTQPTAD